LLSYGLAVILLFIGAKMLLTDIVKIPVLVSLGVVVTVLVITMVWSARTAPKLRESIPKCPDPVEQRYGDS
jgi:tellurite resistance protein TerC